MANISNKGLNASVIEDEVVAAPEWVYINIPTRDITDYPFDGVGINAKHFGTASEKRPCDCADAPGCQVTGAHKVTPAVAKEIQSRLSAFQQASMRLFSNRVNLNALREIAGQNISYANSQREFVAEANKLV